jgi:hypothetical protein
MPDHSASISGKPLNGLLAVDRNETFAVAREKCLQQQSAGEVVLNNKRMHRNPSFVLVLG